MYPLILAFRLADPDIREAIMSGRIISLSILINSSPGYEMRRMVVESGPTARRARPRATPNSTPEKVRRRSRFFLTQLQRMSVTRTGDILLY